MIENTKCVAGKITSYFGDQAFVTVESIRNAKDLPLQFVINAETTFAGPAENDKSFAACREGLNCAVFLKEDNSLAFLSPYYR